MIANDYIDKLLIKCFNDEELAVINQYFKFNAEIISIFHSYDLNTKRQWLRDSIIHTFYNYNFWYHVEDKKWFKALKQYFTNELINTCNKHFIQYCCEYKLLDKDFIITVYNKHNLLFEVIYAYSLQYQDYINSLQMIDVLCI